MSPTAALRMQPEIHQQSVDRVQVFFFSRPNRDSPTPSPAGECVLPSFGSGGGGVIHTNCGRGGWGVPIPTRGQTLWYSRYLPIYALCVHRRGVGTLYTDNMHIQYVRDPQVDCKFLRTLFVGKSQSWWRAALKMRLRKNFITKKFLTVSDLDPDPGFESVSETFVSDPQHCHHFYC